MTKGKDGKNALFLHLSGQSTPTLAINRIVFCKSYDPKLEADTLITDNSEMDRITCTVTQDDQGTITVASTVDSIKAVCDTTTISAIDTTRTQLTLVSATSFGVGNLVYIEEIDGFKANKIVAKSGSIITLQSPVNTLVNNHARVGIGNVAIVQGGNDNPLSGVVFEWLAYGKFKDLTTAPFPFTYKFIEK